MNRCASFYVQKKGKSDGVLCGMDAVYAVTIDRLILCIGKSNKLFREKLALHPAFEIIS